MKTAEEIMEILTHEIDKYDSLFHEAVAEDRPDDEIEDHLISGTRLRVLYKKITGEHYKGVLS